MLRESVPLFAQALTAALEHVDTHAKRLIILVREAAVGGTAGAILLDHNLVAALRTMDSIVPGNINFLLRLSAHTLQNLRLMAKLCKQRCHGVCVFFDQKSVFAIRDILSSATAAHKDACQFTGCRLAHDKAVRVER